MEDENEQACASDDLTDLDEMEDDEKVGHDYEDDVVYV